MPKFQGGNEELYEYLSKNLKFSSFRLEREIKRNLSVKFIVEKDGSISNLTMIKNYNEEIYKQIAIAFNNMAKWDPGVQHQKTVRVKYILPIRIHSR
jgi:protein TonB